MFLRVRVGVVVGCVMQFVNLWRERRIRISNNRFVLLVSFIAEVLSKCLIINCQYTFKQLRPTIVGLSSVQYYYIHQMYLHYRWLKYSLFAPYYWDLG